MNATQTASDAAHQNAPSHLRVEHVDVPLGLTEARPRLSWWLPSGAQQQAAYRIRVSTWDSDAAVWDSGRLDSDQSVLVRYDGPVLGSGQRVRWSVKVWTDLGESDWAAPSWWEMGLLEPAAWVARWVEPHEVHGAGAGVDTGGSGGDAVGAEGGTPRLPGPGYLLRHSFTVDAPAIARARLYVTAHGLYEAFVNGRRVGDMELTPGFTSYWSNLQVQTFDVTDLLSPGENVVGAVLSDGWFRGQNGGGRLTSYYGDRLALLAQLHVEGNDGSSVRIGTGPEWASGTGAIRAADLVEGQSVDFRAEPVGWCAPGANGDVGSDVDGWSPVVMADYAEHDAARLGGSPSPPARVVEEIPAVDVWSPRAGCQVVDLGQNINGWVRLTNLGPAGTTLTLTHGEALDAGGDVTVENVVERESALLAMPEFANMLREFQVDRVVSAGRAGEVFEPRHTTHGFRYVRVEGHPDELGVADVTGMVVHTDMRRTGWFECSDARINKLHEAAVWSFRGNACEIPTDCPTRERAGWTGDWQLFVPTAAFLYDVAGFSVKWLKDLAAEQEADGRVLECAPNAYPPELFKQVGVEPGSAGWGDAAVIVPWEIYRAYGDADLLARQWPSMVAWVDYAARVARERRHPSRAAARPVPAPHETYIWDAGFHYGEWLEPGEIGFAEGNHDNQIALHLAEDPSIVATAYLCYSAGLMARIARVLGHVDDAAWYAELAERVRDAWRAEFVGPDGRLSKDTQANYVRGLAFGLVPDELRGQAAARLVELIREAGTHLGTGFLATPYLLPVLVDAGYADVAFEVLFQDSEPSWLTMVDRGATTIWEAWNGIDDDGAPHLSLNHYSKGAVVSFLHQYVAGIRPHIDGGVAGDDTHGVAYRRFSVVPVPGGGLNWARAVHDSPYGRIESSWRVDDEGQFRLDIVVPPGTRALVVLPDGRHVDASPGSATYECQLRRESSR